MVGEQRRILESLGSEAAAVLANVDAGLANLSQGLNQGLDRHTSMAEQHAAASEQRIQDLEKLQRAVLEKVDSVLQITLEGTEQFVVQAGQTKQRDKATRDLVHELDTARYNIEHTVDELKHRAQSSNRTLDQLEVGYTAFLDGLSDSAADSGARMSNLLIEYSQQMSEQARERLDDWKQMTEEFSAAMAVGLEQMRAALPEARPSKKRAAARRKTAPVPKQAAKKGR